MSRFFFPTNSGGKTLRSFKRDTWNLSLGDSCADKWTVNRGYRGSHDTSAFLFRRRPISRIGSLALKLFFGAEEEEGKRGIRAKKKHQRTLRFAMNGQRVGEERAGWEGGRAGNEARVNATRGIKFGAPLPYSVCKLRVQRATRMNLTAAACKFSAGACKFYCNQLL